MRRRKASDFVSLTTSRKAVSKIKNQTSRRCVTNRTTVLVYNGKSSTLVQHWKAQKRMFELKEYGESIQTVPHHNEQLCNLLAKEGVSVFVKLLRAEISSMSAVENYSSLETLN